MVKRKKPAEKDPAATNTAPASDPPAAGDLAAQVTDLNLRLTVAEQRADVAEQFITGANEQADADKAALAAAEERGDVANSAVSAAEAALAAAIERAESAEARAIPETVPSPIDDHRITSPANPRRHSATFYLQGDGVCHRGKAFPRGTQIVVEGPIELPAMHMISWITNGHATIDRPPPSEMKDRNAAGGT